MRIVPVHKTRARENCASYHFPQDKGENGKTPFGIHAIFTFLLPCINTIQQRRYLLPGFLKYLKNSELGSTTITSLRPLKLAR